MDDARVLSARAPFSHPNFQARKFHFSQSKTFLYNMNIHAQNFINGGEFEWLLFALSIFKCIYLRKFNFSGRMFIKYLKNYIKMCWFPTNETEKVIY
jgi:hypothetical protein